MAGLPRGGSAGAVGATERFLRRCREIDRSMAVAALTLAVALTFLIAAPEAPRPGPMKAAALIVFFLGLWTTKAASDHLAAILFFTVAVAVVGVPPEVAFSGFHTGAAWLVLGGFIIAAAVKHTGLGTRIARAALGRTGRSYGLIVTGAVLVGTTLAFLVPSAIARVMLLMPVVIALADRLDLPPGSPGRNGIVLAAALGTFVPSFAILPATMANIVMAAGAQALYGLEIGYGDYLLANFPVLGLTTVLILPLAICALFPARLDRVEAAPDWAPLTADEWRLLVILAVALALWATDVVHGIAPAWVALGAGALCLLPRVGPARAAPFAESVNIGTWMLLTALVSLGTVLNYCGLGAVVGQWLVTQAGLAPGEPVHNFAALTAIGMAVTAVATVPAAPTIMTPLAGQFSTATGWPLETVLMTQVPTWFYTPLPHQTAILLIAAAIGGVPLGALVRLLVVLTVIGVVVVLPLHFLWLTWLGYLP